jgi:hypothetical protein
MEEILFKLVVKRKKKKKRPQPRSLCSRRDKQSNLKNETKLGLVAHVCNPTY